MKVQALYAGTLVVVCWAGGAGAVPRPIDSLASLPVVFEENAGQAGASVEFLARGPGYDLLFTSSEVMLAVRPRGAGERGAIVRLTLPGASARAPVGETPLSARVNYFRGRDPTKWRTGVPTYERLRYRDVYPGIDVVYYINQGRLEYDFVVSPGADPGRIRMAFHGQQTLRLDDGGNLVLALPGGDLVQHPPRIYQEIDGARHPVAGRYERLADDTVGLRLEAHDADRALVIDPVLEYSSYLGGSGEDVPRDVAVDAAGNMYVVGTTQSADFPVVDAYQPGYQGAESTFVAKIAPGGRRLVFATHLSGTSDIHDSSTLGRGIAVDGAGNVYVTGTTVSFDYPVRNAFQDECVQSNTDDQCVDAFVTKLSPSGSELVFSTYIGGNDYDYAYDVAVDSAGNAHIVGDTWSYADFPLRNELEIPREGEGGAYVAKLNAAGSALVYATHMPGASVIRRIALDDAGDAYVAGTTTAASLPPVPGGFPPTHIGEGGLDDVLVARISRNGPALSYLTYLGGADFDRGFGIAVDGQRHAYVTGHTQSVYFPTRNALTRIGDGRSAFVSKLTPDGKGLVYSTTLGGDAGDDGWAIAVDDTGHAYVVGNTDSRDFPVVEPLRPYCPFTTFRSGGPTYCGGLGAFIAKLGISGAALDYSTYFATAESTSVAVQGHDAYFSGFGSGDVDLPVKNAFQPDAPSAGVFDGFVARISDRGPEPNIARSPLVPLGDLNGDARDEVAVFYGNGTGAMSARVVDVTTGTVLSTVWFAAGHQPIDMGVLPDVGGNGVPELAVLERALDRPEVRVQVRDALTGAWHPPVHFDQSIIPERLAVVPDLNGNGSAEVALVGVQPIPPNSGRRMAQVKDSFSRASLSGFAFDAFDGGVVTRIRDLAVVPDVNGNGSSELALLDARRARVELRDAWNGGRVTRLFYQQWMLPLQIGVLPDGNGNGAAALAVHARGEGAAVRTLDIVSKSQLGTAYFAPAFRQQQMVVVPDLQGTPAAELAMLSISAAGFVKVEIRDAASGQPVRNVWFGTLSVPFLVALADTNGNGSVELAVLGRNAAGDLRLEVKDSATNALIRRVTL